MTIVHEITSDSGKDDYRVRTFYYNKDNDKEVRHLCRVVCTNRSMTARLQWSSGSTTKGRMDEATLADYMAEAFRMAAERMRLLRVTGWNL